MGGKVVYPGFPFWEKHELHFLQGLNCFGGITYYKRIKINSIFAQILVKTYFLIKKKILSFHFDVKLSAICVSLSGKPAQAEQIPPFYHA